MIAIRAAQISERRIDCHGVKSPSEPSRSPAIFTRNTATSQDGLGMSLAFSERIARSSFGLVIAWRIRRAARPQECLFVRQPESAQGDQPVVGGAERLSIGFPVGRIGNPSGRSA